MAREWQQFNGTLNEAQKAACICQDGGMWIETMDGYRIECMHCHAEIDDSGSNDMKILKGRKPTYREEMDRIFRDLVKE